LFQALVFSLLLFVLPFLSPCIVLKKFNHGNCLPVTALFNSDAAAFLNKPVVISGLFCHLYLDDLCVMHLDVNGPAFLSFSRRQAVP